MAGLESGPMATFRMMKLCYPHLKGDGCIINLGSSPAKRLDTSNYGCYAATKEAIRSLTRAAACAWAVAGVRANAILPHALSPGLKRWTEDDPEAGDAFVRSIPMRLLREC